MLTKIDAINLIQIELASGKMTADLRGKYPIPVISRWLGAGFDEISKSNIEAKAATAIEYIYDPSLTIQLSPRPMAGESSFMYVNDANKSYRLGNISTNNTLKVLRGGEVDNQVTLTNKSELIFVHVPQGKVKVCYVPNFWEMKDTDVIVMAGSERFLLNMVIDQMRKNDVRPQEILNDSKVDSQ